MAAKIAEFVNCRLIKGVYSFLSDKNFYSPIVKHKNDILH